MGIKLKTTYPYFNDEFKTHTNASHLQVGVVIIKKGEPIDLHNR